MRFAENQLSDYPVAKKGSKPATIWPPIRPVLDALTLTPSSVVLALGAEAGRFTYPLGRYFSRMNGSGIVFACDFTEKGVHRLQCKARDAHLGRYVLPRYLHDVSRNSIPIETEMVDTIISINTMSFQDAPMPFMEECLRILKPCGSLFLGKWNVQSPNNSQFLRRFRMSQAEVWQHLKQSGTDICTAYEIPGLDWAVMMVKPLVQLVV